MIRPSFQFYPNDWRGNSNLRRCSFTERGIWLEVMCLMHDASIYGVLQWPLKEIARAVGCSVKDLQGLIGKGVLKGADTQLADPFVYIPRSGRKDGNPVVLIPAQAGPLWYSSRMVRDEHVRNHRGETSRFGVNNGDSPDAAPKDAPKPPLSDGSSSSASSSSSSKQKKAASFDASGIDLPEWLPRPSWQTWVEFRKEIRKPITESQARATFSKLRKWRDGGHDVEAIIEHSIASGYQGMFLAPIKGINGHAPHPRAADRELGPGDFA